MRTIFEGSRGQGGERWIKYTAIKILQDLDDVRKFDIKSYLPFLAHIENPNGEKIEMLRRYNQIFPKMYADPEKVNIDSCYEMWKEFDIGDELAAKVKLQAEEYSRDASVIGAVLKIYPEMLKRVE